MVDNLRIKRSVLEESGDFPVCFGQSCDGKYRWEGFLDEFRIFTEIELEENWI